MIRGVTETTFALRSLKYRGKAHKGCTLYLNDELKDVKILAKKNRIFFLNRQLYFLNKPISVVAFTYDASTTVDLQGRQLTVNKDIAMEAPGRGESSKIAELISQPRREAEAKSREMLLKAEDQVRDFLQTRHEALEFLSDLRRNPRKTLFDLSLGFATTPGIDPIDATTKMYAERLSKSTEGISSSLAEVESDRAQRLYAVLYFIGKLQDVFFEGRDPKKLQILKEFGFELGFHEELLEDLDGKSAEIGVLNLFRNVQLIDLAQSAPQ